MNGGCDILIFSGKKIKDQSLVAIVHWNFYLGYVEHFYYESIEIAYTSIRMEIFNFDIACDNSILHRRR